MRKIFVLAIICIYLFVMTMADNDQREGLESQVREKRQFGLGGGYGGGYGGGLGYRGGFGGFGGYRGGFGGGYGGFGGGYGGFGRRGYGGFFG